MKIKICGLSRACDIDYVNEAQPDFIGFVFAESKRRVTLEQAARLRQKLRPGIRVVGVFVNEALEVVNTAVQSGVIDLVQLHGQEDEAYIGQVEAEVIKALRLGEAQPQNAAYLLFDGARAGSGEVLDWARLPQTHIPYFLAGGIRAENIGQAMELQPYGLDVSSGAETDGYKDRDKIRELVRRLRNG